MRLENGTPTYIHNDHLGSPIAASDGSGTFLWFERYLPFGEALNAPAPNEENQGFTGHVSDTTGLVYMQARYYNPSIGRFLASDPADFSPSVPALFHRYVYGFNNPINSIDPDGRIPIGILPSLTVAPVISNAINYWHSSMSYGYLPGSSQESLSYQLAEIMAFGVRLNGSPSVQNASAVPLKTTLIAAKSVTVQRNIVISSARLKGISAIKVDAAIASNNLGAGSIIPGAGLIAKALGRTLPKILTRSVPQSKTNGFTVKVENTYRGIYDRFDTIYGRAGTNVTRWYDVTSPNTQVTVRGLGFAPIGVTVRGYSQFPPESSMMQ